MSLRLHSHVLRHTGLASAALWRSGRRQARRAFVCQRATESVMQRCRSGARPRASPGAAQPNMVCSSAVHVCWEKLFNYFDIEPRYIHLTEDCFVAKPEKVALIMPHMRFAGPVTPPRLFVTHA